MKMPGARDFSRLYPGLQACRKMVIMGDCETRQIEVEVAERDTRASPLPGLR